MYQRTAILTIALLIAGVALAADDKDTKKSGKPDSVPVASKKADEPTPTIVARAQLPRGWKSLGLTDKQKKQILSTRTQYAAKHQALLEQLEKLKTEEMESLNNLLTDAQRQRLAELKK